MLVKTRGIVLRFIKYRETSIIVSIYTESLGLQNYIVNSIRSSKSKYNRIALFQPLTLLDMVVYFREQKQLQRLSEVKCQNPYFTIHLNPKKSAIALFLMEILMKTIKEQAENRELFNFIWDALLLFDSDSETGENFHLVFLIKLTRYLGFGLQNAEDIYRDLKNELGSGWLNGPEGVLMNQLIHSNFVTTPELKNRQRAGLLSTLIAFYQLHVHQFGAVKSIKVLNQVFK